MSSPSYSTPHSPPPSYSPSPSPPPPHPSSSPTPEHQRTPPPRARCLPPTNIDPNIPSNYPHLFTAAYNGIRDGYPRNNIELRFRDAMRILVSGDEPEQTVPAPVRGHELGFDPGDNASADFPSAGFPAADAPSNVPETNDAEEDTLHDLLALQETAILIAALHRWLVAHGWEGKITHHTEKTIDQLENEIRKAIMSTQMRFVDELRNVDPNVPSNYPQLYRTAYRAIYHNLVYMYPTSDMGQRFQDAMRILARLDEAPSSAPLPPFEPGMLPLDDAVPEADRAAKQLQALRETSVLIEDVQLWLETHGCEGEVTRRMEPVIAEMDAVCAVAEGEMWIDDDAFERDEGFEEELDSVYREEMGGGRDLMDEYGMDEDGKITWVGRGGSVESKKRLREFMGGRQFREYRKEGATE